jgi:hypothetical protein
LGIYLQTLRVAITQPKMHAPFMLRTTTLFKNNYL